MRMTSDALYMQKNDILSVETRKWTKADDPEGSLRGHTVSALMSLYTLCIPIP